MSRSLVLLSRKLIDVIQNGDAQQVERLLKQGADPSLLQSEGIAPFHYAVGQQDLRNPELTRLMLEYGGDPNVRSSEGMTPMHVAATWGHLECLRLLLLNGGDPQIRDQDGLDCLDLAHQYENGDCENLLLEFTHEAEDDCCKYTIVPYEDKEAVSFLLNDPKPLPNRIRPSNRNTAIYTEDMNNILSSYLLDDDRDGKVIFDVTSPSHPYIEPRESHGGLKGHLNYRRSSDNHSDVTGSSDDSFVTCTSEDAEKSPPKIPASVCQQKNFYSKRFEPMAASSPPSSIVRQKKVKVRSSRDVHNDSGIDASSSCINSISLRDDLCHRCSLNTNQNHCSTQCCDSPSNQRNLIPYCQNTPSHYCPSHHQSIHQRCLPNIHCSHSCPASIHNKQPSPSTCSHHHQQTACVISNSCSHCNNKCSPVKTRSDQCLVDKFTGISLDEDRKSEDGSLFSHISSIASSENMLPEMKRNPEQNSRQDKNKKSTHIGDLSITETDSLASYIPNEFNMSDLTINSNNCQKLEAAYEKPMPYKSDRTSIESALSSASTIDYLYIDPEEGVTLIERHCPSICSGGSSRTSLESPGNGQHEELAVSDDDTVLYDWEDYISSTPAGTINQFRLPRGSNTCVGSIDSDKTITNTPCSQSKRSASSVATPDSQQKTLEIPSLLRRLSNKEVKDRLVSLGDDPGPVTKFTRQTYLTRLVDLENNPDISRLILSSEKPGFSRELKKALAGNFDNSGLEEIEMQMVEAFQRPDPERKWREGILKSSFNYLLLDPRIALNLPVRAQAMGELEIFKHFISAIFYIGKGKRSRPYCHLYEAIKHRNNPQGKKPSEKVAKILDIWKDGSGVISLHIFQNVIPVEAYTREACMVDAIGLGILTNKKKGDYYGVSSTWSACKRRQVGVHLLKKALRIYLAEGERQISPPDIGIGQ